MKDFKTQEPILDAEQGLRGEVFVTAQYEPKDDYTYETIRLVLDELGIARKKYSDQQKYIYCLSDFFSVADRYRDRLICWEGSNNAFDRGSAYRGQVARDVRNGLIKAGYLEPEGKFSAKDGLAQAYRVIGSEIPTNLAFKCHGIGPLVIVREQKEKCHWKPVRKGKALGRNNIMPISGHPTLAEYEDDILRLNKLNLQYPLIMPDGSEFVSHRRICVGGKLDCGGRHYGPWQLRPESERVQSTIGGESVVEIDLKAAHPNIINAYVGDKSSLGPDPYNNIPFVKGEKLDGDRRRMRDVAKRLISAYCCKDGSMDQYPIGEEKEFCQKEGREKTIPFAVTYRLDRPVGYYMDQIFSVMPFLQDKDKMQDDVTFIESEIMRRAVNNLVKDGKPCYMVHDCLMVRESDRDVAIAYLQNSLSHRLGFVCEMDVTDCYNNTYLAKIPDHYQTSKPVKASYIIDKDIEEDYSCLIDEGDIFSIGSDLVE